MKYITKNKLHFNYVFTSHVYLNALIGLLLKFKALKTEYFIARESTSIFTRFKGSKLLSYKLAYKIGYYNINLLICQTQFMKDQLILNIPFIKNRTLVKVIPNPINLNYSQKIKTNQKIQSCNHDYIVSAGRLIDEKGFDILIKSFELLKKDFPNLYLYILGNGQNKTELKSLVNNLNLSTSVIFTGHVDDVYSYFKYAKICVVSSRVEGFPNVLLQMMSQNTKVVSTLCAGGINEIKGIFTCNTECINSLYESLKLCYSSDTSFNRKEFDLFLETRTIIKFIQQINSYIE
ncbi:glycosyltransferase [Formosa haliotis]|uniref:glycosyltransferase n=1 Tax=Formosa haliotis TaxID=1555194 RepID=UPI00082656F1|nr:glycosyltransferase [Formosa haliotis]